MLTSIKLSIQLLVDGGSPLFQVFMFTSPFGVVNFFGSHLAFLQHLKGSSWTLSFRLRGVEDKAWMTDVTCGYRLLMDPTPTTQFITYCAEQEFGEDAEVTRVRDEQGRAPCRDNKYLIVSAQKNFYEFKGLVNINGITFGFKAKTFKAKQPEWSFTPEALLKERKRPA